MKILKGDTVKVLYGKYAGKTGVVSRVLPKKNKVVVEGVNKAKRHIKATQQGQASGIVEITKPMHVSKVQLVDPNTGKATRVRYQVDGDKKVRVAVKGGKTLGDADSTGSKSKKDTSKKSTKKTASSSKGKDDKKVESKKSTKKSTKKDK